jgi:hypothetical protein
MNRKILSSFRVVASDGATSQLLTFRSPYVVVERERLARIAQRGLVALADAMQALFDAAIKAERAA